MHKLSKVLENVKNESKSVLGLQFLSFLLLPEFHFGTIIDLSGITVDARIEEFTNN